MKTLLIITQLVQLLSNGGAVEALYLGVEKASYATASTAIACASMRPNGIEDLADGVVIDAYDFFDGDEKYLGILGFLNVDIKKQERVTVVEYLQKGSISCMGAIKRYGIGARLMMRVTSHNRKARLDTPQQITASVIFGHATVKFSMRTFGITGPGVANLNQIGSITENTYSGFISGISDLLAKAYDRDQRYIIKPQLLEGFDLHKPSFKQLK